MQVRDRVKQTATHSGGTFDLAVGAAADGHVTFADAYGFSGLSAGAFLWNDVPLLIERANGEWQVALARLNRDDSPVVQTLNTVVFYSSSTGSALVFDASEEVTISLVPAAVMFSAFALAPLDVPAGDQHRDSSVFYPYVGPAGTGGLLAIGQGSSAAGLKAVAIGDNAGAGYAYAAAIGGKNINAMTAAGLASGIGFVEFFAGAMEHWLTAERCVLNAATPDATPKAMGLSEDGSTNILNSDSIYCDAGITRVKGSIVAISAAGDMKVWDVDFAAKTTLDYATTALFGSLTKTVVNADAGAAAWDFGITFDSPTNTCVVEVTGAAATNIVWAARLDVVTSAVYV
jgi:hypothetical protein